MVFNYCNDICKAIQNLSLLFSNNPWVTKTLNGNNYPGFLFFLIDGVPTCNYIYAGIRV